MGILENNMTSKDLEKMHKVFTMMQQGSTQGEMNAAHHALNRFATKYGISVEDLITYLRASHFQTHTPPKQHTKQYHPYHTWHYDDFVNHFFANKRARDTFKKTFRNDTEETIRHKKSFEKRKQEAYAKNPEQNKETYRPSYTYHNNYSMTQKDKERIVSALLKEKVPLKRIKEHIPLSSYEIAGIFLKMQRYAS